MQIKRRIFKEEYFRFDIWIIIFLLTTLSLSFGSAQLSAPTIGSDQLIYACANKEVVAFRGNGTLVWSVDMNQTCQVGVAPVLDYDGRVYVAADRTVVVATPPASEATKPSAANFFSTVPATSLKAIGTFSSVTGLGVTAWSSVLYVNTGTGIHAFMLDGTPLWSTLVQFNNSVMKSPESMGPCAHNMTNCTLLPSLAVDQCDGSIYVARTDGWLFSYATWQPFLRWRYALSVDVPLSVKLITGNNGRIYAAMAKYDTVYAISTDTGTLIWQAKVGPLSEKSCTPIVDLLGFVSVGSLDGFLYVISPDGAYVSKYLATDNSSPFSIQTAPVLDCSKEALYVAQTRVMSKTILQQMDGTKSVSFTQFLGMNIYMLVPSRGQVLWNTLYPGLFPAALLMRDLSSYSINPDWLIALTVIANLSSKSLCETQQKLLKITCSQSLFTMSKIQHPGNNKPMIAFSISVFVIFLLLSLLSVLMYCCWRKRQVLHRYRLRRLLKQERFRHPQGLLLKRRKMYQQNIQYLQAELEVQPRSSKILGHLKAAIEGLHFIERYLALFPSETLLDHFHQERLFVKDAIAASTFTPTNSQGGFWTTLLDSAFHILFGVPKEEDFTEEMNILSLYNDCPLTAPLIPTFPKQGRPQVQQQVSLQVLPDGSSRKYLSAALEQDSTEEYSNPLYNQSPTIIARSTKKTVSFSPVNEIFDQHSSSASNVSTVSSEVKSAELASGSTDYVFAETAQEDSCLDDLDGVG